MTKDQVEFICHDHGYSLVEIAQDFNDCSIILYLEKMEGVFKDGDLFRALEEHFWKWRFYVIISNNFGEK